MGLRLRSCGEHPQAADAAGINVAACSTQASSYPGVLGGLGAGVVVPTSTNFNAMWPIRIPVLAALIFGQ
ncbi:ABC transporter permease subunit [Enterocloster sp.]|uniref:ABC transporter permease subunit n=1 Tax=Enterocloster sp. TaxID=2719315 RepID=UPI00399F9F4A